MAKVKLLSGILSALILLSLSSCQDKELEDRVENLEKQVSELSAKELISNPNTAKNDEGVDKEVLENAPEMTFTKEIHDFGTINDGDVVKHEFKFTNTGKGPLVISNATASCGCTVPDWPKKPLAPGETGTIPVEFNSKGKKGTQSKKITITANTQPSANYLTIKANVIGSQGNTTPTVTP